MPTFSMFLVLIRSLNSVGSYVILSPFSGVPSSSTMSSCISGQRGEAVESVTIDGSRVVVKGKFAGYTL